MLKKLQVLIFSWAVFACCVTSRAAFIFESATLGVSGITENEAYAGDVPAVNISEELFLGVRFHLDAPTSVDRVGGHFLGLEGGDTFFAAIVKLTGQVDLPDSYSLDSPDVLVHGAISWPKPASAEVFATLNVPLQPGWYALVFGSGLFGTQGSGAVIANGADIGIPAYLERQRIIQGLGWTELHPAFRNLRFAIEGHVIPEPPAATIVCMAAAALTLRCLKRRRIAGAT